MTEPPLQSPADQELVARSSEGDARAFGVLVDRHKDAVYWLVRGLVGRDEAEDVTQEVFIRAYQALPRFRGESRLDTWLLKIARNRCYTLLRKRGTRPEVRELGHETGDDLPAPTSGLPDRILAETELASRVRDAVDTLDPPYGTVLGLYHFEGMPYDRIAEVMDVPMGTVKSYLHRGRRRLRQIVMDDPVLQQRVMELLGAREGETEP